MSEEITLAEFNELWNAAQSGAKPECPCGVGVLADASGDGRIRGMSFTCAHMYTHLAGDAAPTLTVSQRPDR